MSEDPAKDDIPNGRVSPSEADPFGHASLSIVESLIHGLIANGAISVADAVEIVEVAADVKTEIGAKLGHSPASLRRSLTLVKCISDSLRYDLPAI